MEFNNIFPSPYDARDYKAKEYVATGTRPDTFSEDDVPVLNQGKVGSCVAHSLSILVYIIERRKKINELKKNFSDSFSQLDIKELSKKMSKQYSTDFIFHNRLETDYQGEGMYIRQALSQLCKCGDCEFKDLPTNTSYPNKNTTAFVNILKEKAIQNRTKLYYRCEDIEDILNSIFETGAVAITIKSWRSFKTFMIRDDDTMVLSIPKENEEYTGYHCIVAVGYNEKGIIVQNSYGKYWGNNGRAIMPFDYPIEEAWGVESLANTFTTIELEKNKKEAVVNGTKIDLDVPATIIEGRMMVPIRFVAESLNCSVEYDKKTKKVLIVKKEGV